MLGGTAGRTTLNGEGLQHQDGHSPLLFSVLPHVRIYDPAYAYELAVIIRDGVQRMCRDDGDALYYLTLYNENIVQPPMPEGLDEAILRGLYLLRPAPIEKEHRATILASGPAVAAALAAQERLAESHDVAADVWSVTSYQQLRNDALEVERWNRLHPEREPRISHIAEQLGERPGPIIAVTDYVKAVSDQVARFVRQEFIPLGTDGFGRSDTRQALRRHFETDAEHVTVAVLDGLARAGEIPRHEVAAALEQYEIDTELPEPRVR
jgi:pyruvate dehydrogenase E1 component